MLSGKFYSITYEKHCVSGLGGFSAGGRALAMLPAVAGAQAISATPSDVASSTNTYSRFHNRDGSDLPIDVRYQQIKEYRQQSSDLQQKIAALGGIASASVLMPILFGVEVKDISPNFGDPRDGGARTHEGEDS